MFLGLLFVSVLLLAYANGANDNFKATATIYGAEVLSFRKSLSLATLAQVCGSVASLLLAGKLVTVFGGKGLVPDSTVADPAFLLAVGTGAGLTVLIATRLAFPISTTHALIGGLVGAGLALSPTTFDVTALGSTYFFPLITAPVLALVVAAALYPPARRLRRALGLEETTCLCVGDVYQPVAVCEGGSMVLEHSGLELTVSEQSKCSRRYVGSVLGVPAQQLVDVAHGISSLALGFARGLNDTPKIVALLLAAHLGGLEPRISLLVVATAMALGGVLHSRRLGETLGKNITPMNHGQGLLANFVSSSLVIGASLLGSPVSTTHVSTGAIVGVGFTGKGVAKTLLGNIALAWFATLPVGALFAFTIAKAVKIL